MKNKYTAAEIVVIVLITITTISILLFLGERVEKWYFGAALTIIIILAFLYNVYKNLKDKRSLKFINENWDYINHKKRNYNFISKLFHTKAKKLDKEKNFYIDDQTWSDLEMNQVYEKLDYTLTSAGEQKLYDILRKPLYDESKIAKRKELINKFQSHGKLREEIQLILHKAGRQYKGDILDLIYSDEVENSKFKILYDILFVLSLVALASPIFLGKAGILFIIGIFNLNMYIYYKINKSIMGKVNSITYLSDILNASQEIIKIKDASLKEYEEIISKNIKCCNRIIRNSGAIGRLEGIDILGDYFNILFLTKIRGYYKIIDEIQKHKDEIKEIYEALGEIDALISVSIYRDIVNEYTEPVFMQESNILEAVEMINPLIESPVPNDVYIHNEGILLTGSNMSGKSTFLRTLGINSIMAHTIITCLAKEFKTSYFNIMTSISPSDDILKGKSYYLGEAEAVLRILNSLNGKLSTLCIIDEIFRGTNPLERISASAEILSYLADNNALAIVATHDLELTSIVNEGYGCYYFSEEVDEKEGLKFDYKIKKGVSPTRNAIKLLKYLNYPEKITEKADCRVSRQLKESMNIK